MIPVKFMKTLFQAGLKIVLEFHIEEGDHSLDLVIGIRLQVLVLHQQHRVMCIVYKEVVDHGFPILHLCVDCLVPAGITTCAQ